MKRPKTVGESLDPVENAAGVLQTVDDWWPVCEA